jgi:hypothetical protein
MDAQQPLFDLHVPRERHQRRELQPGNEERFEDILKLRAIDRPKLAKIHVDMFLKIPAHLIVLISDSAALDLCGGKHQAHSFNSASTNNVEPRRRIPILAG